MFCPFLEAEAHWGVREPQTIPAAPKKAFAPQPAALVRADAAPHIAAVISDPATFLFQEIRHVIRNQGPAGLSERQK